MPRDYSAPYNFLIKDISIETGVPVELIKAVMNVESQGKASAVSKKGARGLMQVMPATKKMLQNWYKEELGNITDDKDPRENIRLGAYYLKKLMELHGDDTDKVIAGYYTGHSRDFLEDKDWKSDPKYKEWGIGDYVDKVKGYLSETPPEPHSVEPSAPPSVEPSASPKMNRREATETKRRNLQAVLDNLKAKPNADPQAIKNLEKIIQRYSNFDLPGQEAFPREQPMDYVPPTARDREFDLPDIQTGPQDDRPMNRKEPGSTGSMLPRYYDESQPVIGRDRRSLEHPAFLKGRDRIMRGGQEPALTADQMKEWERQQRINQIPPIQYVGSGKSRRPEELLNPDQLEVLRRGGQLPQGEALNPIPTYDTITGETIGGGGTGLYSSEGDPYGRGDPTITGEGSMAPPDARSVDTTRLQGYPDTIRGSTGAFDWREEFQKDPQPQSEFADRLTSQFGQSMAPQDQAQPDQTATATQDVDPSEMSLLGQAAAKLGISLLPRGEDTGKRHVDFASVSGGKDPKDQSWLRKAWETGEKYLEPVAEYGKYLPIPYVQQGLTAVDALYDAEDAISAANRGDYVGAALEGAGAVGGVKDFQALQEGGGPNPLSAYNVLGDQAGSSELHKGIQKTATKIGTDVVGKALTGGDGGGSGGRGSSSPYMDQADSAANRYRQQSIRANQDYQRLTGGRLSAQGIQGPTREGIIGRQAANLTASTQQNIAGFYSQAAQREQMAQIMRDRQDKQNWMAMLKGLSDMYGIATMDTDPANTENPYLPNDRWVDEYFNPGGQNG